MASESRHSDRDSAVRSMLVRLPQPGVPGTTRPALTRDRARVPVITAAVLVAVIALSVLAIGFRAGRDDRPAFGGGSASAPTDVLPTAPAPTGTLLGRFTSDDGPKQTHTIHPDGLALAVVFACSGTGDWLIHIPHDSDSAAVTPPGQKPGRCDGHSSSAGNKGHAGSATVAITTEPGMRWTLTVVGIPETYVTPQPVEAARDSAGAAVPFCSAADLAARFEPKQEPEGVTEVAGGQIALTNTTGTGCALAGWPMVRFLDRGSALGHHSMNAIDERSSTEKGLDAVVLQPGASAYTQVGWYLPDYYPENEQGPCVARPVSSLRIDLDNRFAGAAQAGDLEVPIGSTVTACLNGPWGVDGKYGQISSTVFVDYSLHDER